MKKYDAFIVHAYEDESTFSNELAHALKNEGLRIWYAGFELHTESAIGAAMTSALRETRFGIIILSPVYLRKTWASVQINKLFIAEQKKRRMLPVYQRVDIEALLLHFPDIPQPLISAAEELSDITRKLRDIICRKKNRKAASATTTDSHEPANGLIILRDMPAGKIVPGQKRNP